MLHNVSDATIQLYGALVGAGWLAGVAFALAVWWRSITRSRHENREIRRLRMALEDSDRQVTEGFKTADRMARMIADQAGRPGGKAA